MYDVITIGSASRDAFVKSEAFEVHVNDHQVSEGCFPLGAKIEVQDLLLETGGGATNAAVTFTAYGFYVGTTGNVNVVTSRGNTVLFTGVPAGTIIPLCISSVRATNTTASTIVGFGSQ